MKNETRIKIIAAIAICLAIVGVSIGFVAFTSTLSIQNATATVRQGGNDAFTTKIGYNGTISCTPTGSDEIINAGEGKKGYNKGTAANLVWSDISATLYKPGDKLTCTATVSNESEYIAYLNSISTLTGITCSSDASSKKDMCNNIKATLNVDTASITITNESISNTSISENTISAINGTKDVTLTVEYLKASKTNADISVTIPTISLVYDISD